MSRSHDVPTRKVFDAQALSSTNTVYSGAANPKEGGGNAIGTDLPYSTYVSYVGSFTGTANGTLTVEVSNSDPDAILRGADVWITYTPLNGGGFVNGVATVASGQISGSATFGIKMRPGFRRTRLKYVNSSNSGTLTVELTVKGA